MLMQAEQLAKWVYTSLMHRAWQANLLSIGNNSNLVYTHHLFVPSFQAGVKIHQLGWQAYLLAEMVYIMLVGRIACLPRAGVCWPIKGNQPILYQLVVRMNYLPSCCETAGGCAKLISSWRVH
jgi:hypothetical protein